MKRLTTRLWTCGLLACLALAGLALPRPAHASVHISVGIGLPVPVFVAPAPVFVAPPPPVVVGGYGGHGGFPRDDGCPGGGYGHVRGQHRQHYRGHRW